MAKNEKSGWVSLHRQIQENELYFLEPFTKAQAWIDLILNANHKENIVSIRGNVIKIKRGQIGWSELTMAKRWKWSKNKVRRFLKYLETIQQIEQQKDRFITTIITILNYDKYQNDTADDKAERQQKDSRRYINNNDNNENNDNKTITKVIGETPVTEKTDKRNPEIQELWEHGLNLGFSNTKQQLNRFALKRLLRDKTVDQLKKASKFSQEIRADPYAPQINNWLDLEDKYLKLRDWVVRQNNKPATKSVNLNDFMRKEKI